MKLHKDQLDSNIKQLVTTARSILTNQVGLPFGAIRITRIIAILNQFQALSKIDLAVFDLYRHELSGFPIGTERLRWEKEALLKQDESIEVITKKYKSQIFEKCYQIIEMFGSL